MKVLDLFAGLKGWSRTFEDRGHEVFAIDYDKQFDVDLHADISKVTPDDLPWTPDIVLASPPCESFSVMNIGRNWTKPTDDPPNAPKTEKAAEAWHLVVATLDLIQKLDPAFWIMENPRAKLRRCMDTYYPWVERVTVTYCQYGESWMKPTDLWGGFPPSWKPRPVCKPGSDCHESAPRGSRKGIQAAGLTPEMRAKVPDQLSLSVCLAAEQDLIAA